LARDTKFEVGQIHEERIHIDAELVERFAAFSGDVNPLHVDPTAAREYGFARPVAHGVILVAVLSRLIGTELPGSGAVWLRQSVEWRTPVFAGDDVDMQLKVTAFSASTGILELAVSAQNQKGDMVMEGTGQVKVVERIGRKDSTQEASDRVVLVTGASRGIGAEIASCLAAEGWTTALNFRSSEAEASQQVSRIQEMDGKARLFKADVSDPGEVSQLVSDVLGAFGRIDAVVHSATPPVVNTPLDHLGYSDLDPYLRTYVGGALALIAAAAPSMKERGFGRFVFIGTSYLFGTPPSGLASYVTAKAAMEGLMRSAATELGPSGITANMISPSLTITDLTDEVPQRVKEVEARKSPARRLANPQDAATAAAFLLSDVAGYVNGVNLPLTGGPV
jgi:3-oxoacyl-[acyl-carrier protein] reductase